MKRALTVGWQRHVYEARRNSAGMRRRLWLTPIVFGLVVSACEEREPIDVRASSDQALDPCVSYFGSNQTWIQGPFKGDVGTFLVDVTGDHRADAIAVNRDGIYVRESNGSEFSAHRKWTLGPFIGDRGRNFFADVTGDGKADAIVVNNDKIYVRKSNGVSFEENETWTTGPFIGQVLQGFADVNGDGMADAVVLNGDAAYVRTSYGSGFFDSVVWTQQRTPGPFGWRLGDLNGDGLADLFSPGCDLVYAYSNGLGFGEYQTILTGCSWFPNFFADIYGDRAVEALLVSSDAPIYAYGRSWSDPAPFSTRSQVTCESYVSNGAGQMFADVNNDGKADAVVFNKTETVVRLAAQ